LFKGYRNIESLDPNEFIRSDKHSIDIEKLVCKTCKLFAVMPRECVTCHHLICNKCVLKAGDSKNCPSCKLSGGKPNSLDYPNIISHELEPILK